MDVLPPRLSVIDPTGLRVVPNRFVKRVTAPEWSESVWDRVIIENADVICECLREAQVIGDDEELLFLGTQIVNIDVVFAVVGTDSQGTQPSPPR